MKDSQSIKNRLVINGLNIEATFYKEDVETIFLPLLKSFSDIERQDGKRTIVFIAAPPGTGKSTLVSFLEDLSLKTEGIAPVQAVGMDGFHYPNDYLNTHHIDDDEDKPLLMTVKGAQNTFDVPKLKKTLSDIKEGKEVIFPIYSRVSHDVTDDGIKIERDIVVLEGNYLLLDIEPWKELKDLADYTIFIEADPKTIKKNLIKRKIDGGATLDQAIRHYDDVDAKNIVMIDKHTAQADLVLHVDDSQNYSLRHKKDKKDKRSSKILKRADDLIWS